MNKIATAKIKYLRIGPRKMVGICKLIRGKDVLVAKSVLLRTPKKGARLIEKALASVIANAKNKNMDEKKLIIKEIKADLGPSYKRYIPWSKGSPRPIKKRTTHLTIVLEEKEGVKAKEAKGGSTSQAEVEPPKTKEEVKKPVKGKKAKGGVKVSIKKNISS